MEKQSLNLGFSATIRNISLFDYLELLIMTKKNKTIEIRSNNLLGLIQLLKGKVIFSKTSSGKSGQEAFYEIMNWKAGTLKDIEHNIVLKKNIEDRGNLLLMAAEYIDNLKKDINTQKLNLNSAIKNENHEETNDCSFLSECSVLKNCRSEGVRNMWTKLYCKTKKQDECHRKLLFNQNKDVSEFLLPNGNFLE